MEESTGRASGAPTGAPDAEEIHEAVLRIPDASPVFPGWTAPDGAPPIDDASLAEELRPRTRLRTAGAEALSPVFAGGAVCLLALVAVAVCGYPAPDADAGRPLTQAAVSLPREGCGQLVGVSSAVPWCPIPPDAVLARPPPGASTTPTEVPTRQPKRSP